MPVDEVAEMLADTDAEELVHGTEDGDIGLSLAAFESWVCVCAGERREEVAKHGRLGFVTVKARP